MHDSGQRQQEKTGALSDPSQAEIAMELLSPYSLQQLATWLGKGAVKYAPRNWEQGIPFSVCIGKLLRHLAKYERGLIDEDHLAAVGFWWHALSHYEAMIERGLLPKTLDNLPKYERQEFLNEETFMPIDIDKVTCVLPKCDQKKPKITRIFLDIDDVLAELTLAVCKKLEISYRPEIFKGEYSLEKILGLPCESGQIWVYYKNIFDENFWTNLLFTKNAHNIIKIAIDIIGAGNVYLLTRPTGIEGCLEGKKQWITKNLPEFSKYIIFTHDKSVLAAPTSLLIDDSDEQVNNWRAAGGQAILYPFPGNSRWKEADKAFEILQQELEKYVVKEKSAWWCPSTLNICP